MEGIPFDSMERHQVLGFDTVDHQESYEADYKKRAQQHGSGELGNTNDSLNTNLSKLFESVPHGVLIAGFKHSRKQDGVWTGRSITDAAMAGCCGQLYTTGFVQWCREPRVEMLVRALHEIETSKIHPFMASPTFRTPPSVWKALDSTLHIDLLTRENVELDIDKLVSATTRVGMENLINVLPTILMGKLQAIDDNELLSQSAKVKGIREICYVARGIQLARFQQALMETSDGKSFFTGKAHIPGNPGRRVFEDFVEIEDLSRALELTPAMADVNGVLAQKPYYYLHTIEIARVARQPVETSVRKPRGRPRRALPQPGEIVESLQDQIRKSLAMTTTVSTLPRFLDPELEKEPASRAESIEPIESIDGGDDRTPAGVESDEEFGEDWKQTGENLRKLASDKTQLEERKTEAIQKQKDNNFDLWFAKEKQSFAQDRLRALEQELKDGEDDLERLERERQESVLELKKVEKEAKMLSVEITLAKNKRKRAELEREERQAKKQKQALETEVEEE